MLIRNKFDFSVEDSKVAEAAKMDGFSGTGKSGSPLSEAKSHIVYPFLRKEVLHKAWLYKISMLLMQQSAKKNKMVKTEHSLWLNTEFMSYLLEIQSDLLCFA